MSKPVLKLKKIAVPIKKRPSTDTKTKQPPQKVPKRSKNFSEDDISLLFDLVSEHDEILLNKKTDAVSTKYKDKIWAHVTKEFNAQLSKPGDPSERTVEQIKNCHKNCQTRARKQISDEKVEVYRTGGGTNSKTVSEATRKLVAMAPHLYIPPGNKFDSDTKYIHKADTANDETEGDVEEEGDEEKNSVGSQNAPPDVVAKCNMFCEMMERVLADECDSETVKIDGHTRSPIIMQHKLHRTKLVQSVQGTSTARVPTPQSSPLKPAQSKTIAKSAKSVPQVTINLEEVSSCVEETPGDSQASAISSACSASGAFEVNDSQETSTVGEKTTKQPAPKAGKQKQTKTPPARSRRLGSHILASQRFASLAQARMTTVELQLEQMKEQHKIEMKIKQIQLECEQVKLKKLMNQ